MKKIIAAFLILAFVSCNKNSDKDLETVTVDGTLLYSDPAADGTGWSIQVMREDSFSKFYMIQESSIPDNFKTSNIAVTATLKETNTRYWYVMSPTPSNENYYKVVFIKRR